VLFFAAADLLVAGLEFGAQERQMVAQLFDKRAGPEENSGYLS
jgi:hypothetical protein